MTCVREPQYNAFIKLPLPAFLPELFRDLPGSSGIGSARGAHLEALFKNSVFEASLSGWWWLRGCCLPGCFRDASGIFRDFPYDFSQMFPPRPFRPLPAFLPEIFRDLPGFRPDANNKMNAIHNYYVWGF